MVAELAIEQFVGQEYESPHLQLVPPLVEIEPEAQLIDIGPTELRESRPPESEIYGRSLSTIYRLGAYAVGRSHAEVIASPDASQARVEFYTSVEEGFGTDMELGGGLEVRDFDRRPVIDGMVMAKDLKTPVSAMTKNGITKGRIAAEEDSRFLPQLTRSEWDHENALIVDQMARHETDYNTRIIVSPFPVEAAAQSGNKYWQHIGYVPHLKRGFVQLYHVTAEDELIAGSLSFDGSDKPRLREVFSRHGIDVPEDETTDNWLQYAITDSLSEAAAKALATEIADQLGDPDQKKTTNTVDVTRDYGKVIDTVFDESYIHICESLYRGRQTETLTGLIHQYANESRHFIERYKTALYRMRANPDSFTDDDSVVLHELLVYSTIEMMRALHLEREKPGADFEVCNSIDSTYPSLQTVDPSAFQSMLGSFAAEGAKNNRGYSACGLGIKLGEDAQKEGLQTAFGGQADEENKQEPSGKKLMNCPFCPAKVFDDPCARVLKCGECGAKVVDGKLVSKGDGGSRARRAAREAAVAKKVAATQGKMRV